MADLLSEDLKRSLGQNIDVMPGTKKKKKTKKKDKPLTKSAQKKKNAKLDKGAKRMRSEVQEAEERKKLFDRLEKSALPSTEGLRASATLRRKHKKSREERLPPAKAKQEDEEEESSVEYVIVPRAVAAPWRTLAVPLKENKKKKKEEEEQPKQQQEEEQEKRKEGAREAVLLPHRRLAEERRELPVVAAEGDVMEAVSSSDVVAVTGATGSGKSTQMPQFLLEHGYRANGMIAVTQPRRVAARTLSERVAFETGLEHGSQVCYRVRNGGNVPSWDDCQILFLTDGLLLAWLAEDPLLERFGSLVIDEAHERSIGTDVVLGALSRIVPLRRRRFESGESNAPPLRIIIMSATLALGPILRVFGDKAPVVSVAGRQFPVKIHWLKITPPSCAEAMKRASSMISQLDRTLPRGSVLVFVPGRREMELLLSQLPVSCRGVGLHAKQSSKDQEKAIAGAVAKKEEDGDSDARRLVVVATNVAECALTIPGIRYVIDPGFARVRCGTDGATSRFVLDRISQASAAQRSGRAGRTQEGQCYRLYSQPYFAHHMPEQELPQTLSMPADSLSLMLLGLGISHPERFPLPSPPDAAAWEEARTRLAYLGLVTRDGKLTDVGARAAQLPCSPAAARLLLACQESGSQSVLTAGACIAALWDAASASPAAVKLEEGNAWIPTASRNTALLCARDAPQSVLSTGSLLLQRSLQQQQEEQEEAEDEDVQTEGRLQAPLLSSKEDVSLRKAMLASRPHLLCRREGDYYIWLMDGEAVHLHPATTPEPFRRKRPMWVCAAEIARVDEGRRHLVLPFEVSPNWLASVPADAGLLDYQPTGWRTFDRARDMVVEEVGPRYGPLKLSLPRQKHLCKKPIYFAMLLLEQPAVSCEYLRETVASLEQSHHLLSAPQRAYLAAVGAAYSIATLREPKKIVQTAVNLYVPAQARAQARKAWEELVLSK